MEHQLHSDSKRLKTYLELTGYVYKDMPVENEYCVYCNSDKIIDKRYLKENNIREVRIYMLNDIEEYGFTGKHISLDSKYINQISYKTCTTNQNDSLYPLGNVWITGTDGNTDEFKNIVFVLVKEKK